MSVDTALLSEVGSQESGLPMVRVYQWDRPCVSIGRLQLADPVRQEYPGIPCIRRPTGGRAVPHGEDLTISVALKACWLPENAGATILSSYRLLMTGLRQAFAETGYETCFGEQKSQAGSRGAVRCFDVAAGCDLVDARSGSKLVGSAQRRERGALLQQMSFSLTLIPDLNAFIQSLQDRLGAVLHVEEWIVIDTKCTV